MPWILDVPKVADAMSERTEWFCKYDQPTKSQGAKTMSERAATLIWRINNTEAMNDTPDVNASA